MLTRFADEHTSISKVFMDNIVTVQVCQCTQNSSRIMSQEIYVYRQAFHKVEGQIYTTYKFLKWEHNSQIKPPHQDMQY
jgi:hypothetical protein